MGCVGAGARRAARPSCSRPRKPSRKEAPRECPIVPLSGVPIATVRTISGWPAAHRRAHDIRPHQRAATTRVRAVTVLRWLKNGTKVRVLARDAGVSQATAHRLPPAGPWRRSPNDPDITDVLDTLRPDGEPFVRAGGTPVRTDRVTVRTDTGNHPWYSRFAQGPHAATSRS